jgi:transketolase
MLEMRTVSNGLHARDRYALTELAHRVRRHVVRMTTGGGCFLGASLSCTDVLVHLYQRVLCISPATVHHPDRDVLLLSKGHDVPALYGLLAELGYFERELLDRHLEPYSGLYWHPNRKIPGVEFHSGSLGHLLSVGIGVALEARLRGSPARAFVVLGDGECDEGSVWEGLLVASAARLDNLVAVVDRNGIQANARTEDLLPLEPFADKWRAFGWEVVECNGHDFDALERALARVPVRNGAPTVVIAHTVRGKGIPSIERRVDRWFVRVTSAERDALLAELDGQGPATLASETIVAR